MSSFLQPILPSDEFKVYSPVNDGGADDLSEPEKEAWRSGMGVAPYSLVARVDAIEDDISGTGGINDEISDLQQAVGNLGGGSESNGEAVTTGGQKQVITVEKEFQTRPLLPTGTPSSDNQAASWGNVKSRTPDADSETKGLIEVATNAEALESENPSTTLAICPANTEAVMQKHFSVTNSWSGSDFTPLTGAVTNYNFFSGDCYENYVGNRRVEGHLRFTLDINQLTGSFSFALKNNRPGLGCAGSCIYSDGMVGSRPAGVYVGYQDDTGITILISHAATVFAIGQYEFRVAYSYYMPYQT